MHRVLRTFFAQGVIDNPPPGTLDVPSQDLPGRRGPGFMLDEGAELSREVAAEGTVLLKNDDETLPLSPDDSIALIGPDADRYIDMFGSPSVPNPAGSRPSSTASTERSAAEVTYREGADTDPLRRHARRPRTGALRGADARADGQPGEQGLRASYFLGFQGDDPQDPGLVRIEDQVNHRTGTGGLIGIFGLNPSPAPLIPLPYATQPMTAVYEGTLDAGADRDLPARRPRPRHLPALRRRRRADRARAGSRSTTTWRRSSSIAGESYDIRLSYRTTRPGSAAGRAAEHTVRLAWEPPSANASPQIQEAVRAARDSDVAVVVADDARGRGRPTCTRCSCPRTRTA